MWQENQPSRYIICVRGKLDPGRAEWFGSVKLEQTECGNTLLKHDFCDQPALSGILEKIRDLGIELLSVNRLDDRQKSTKRLQS